MNKRIKELADSARVTILTTRGLEGIVDGCYIISPESFYKFAKSVVHECIDAVENSNDRYRRDYFADKIRERFGIER